MIQIAVVVYVKLYSVRVGGKRVFISLPRWGRLTIPANGSINQNLK